jgi:hypothetical protein
VVANEATHEPPVVRSEEVDVLVNGVIHRRGILLDPGNE